jgi:endonuclease YncB( thermonuclease family)
MLAGWGSTIILVIIAALLQWWQDRREGPTVPGELRGWPRLVDGDSFHLGGAEVRLKDIDAPEGRQTCTRNNEPWRCGDAARAELARLIGGAEIVCKEVDRDRYGRYLAYCTANGRDLNRAMVENGFAVAYGGYEREEAQARARRAGLWAGQFERPRAWRREHEPHNDADH